METVFPWRESERGDEEALAAALRRSVNPVMLIRLRPRTPVVEAAGQESFNFGDFFAYTKVCSHLGCPDLALRAADLPHPVPVPPVAVRRPALRQADFRSGRPAAAATADHHRRRGLPGRQRRLHRTRRPGILGATRASMSAVTHPKRRPRARQSATIQSARQGASTSWTRATTRRRGCGSSSTRSSRRTGRSCSARSRCTASSCCCSPAST